MDKSKAKSDDVSKIKETVTKLRQIQADLRQIIANLQQNIEQLDSEPTLQRGIKDFKRDFEERALTLEVEVKKLREELKSVKDLLGFSLENTKSANS